MKTSIHDLKGKIDPEIYKLLKKQDQKQRKNLLINTGSVSGLDQDLAKTLYELGEAGSGTIGLLKAHETIEQKIDPDDPDKEPFPKFNHLYGFNTFIEENYNLDQQRKDLLKSMKNAGVPTGYLSQLLPDNGKKYTQHYPSNLNSPVLAPYPFLNSKLVEEADHLFYEENPHQPETRHLTQTPRKIKKQVKDCLKIVDNPQEHDREDYDIGIGTWIDFQTVMENLQKQLQQDRNYVKQRTIEADGIEITKDLFGYMDQETGKELFFYHQHLNRYDVQRQKNNKYDAGPDIIIVSAIKRLYNRALYPLRNEINKAIQQEDYNKARSLGETVKNLETLKLMEENEGKFRDPTEEDPKWSYTRNFTQTETTRGKDLEKGRCPFTGKSSYLTIWRQKLHKLEEIDADVTINFAEATPKLIDRQVDTDYFQIEHSKEPKTEVHYLAESYAKSKMNRQPRKRKTFESVKTLLDNQEDTVEVISYKEYADNYFGNLKGKNLDCDTLVVCGVPRPSREQLAIQHYLHFQEFPQSMEYNEGKPQVKDHLIKNRDREETHTLTGYWEDSLDLIHTQLIEKELRDATQRLRKQRQRKGKLVIMGYMPELIKQIYPDENIHRYEEGAELLQELLDHYTDKPISQEVENLTRIPSKLPDGLYKHEGKLKKKKNPIAKAQKKLRKELQGQQEMWWKDARQKLPHDQKTIRKAVKQSADLQFQRWGKKRKIIET